MLIRETPPVPRQVVEELPVFALGQARRGFLGVIDSVDVGTASHGVSSDELERRLLELGFVEGMPVEVLHEGAIGRDPIAVRVHGVTVGLRRREAMAIKVRPFSAR